ncbi:hypothetical protein Tco_0844961 [Tanacetum coccineum]
MTNSNTPPPPPALTLVEKLYAVHNINSLVPEKLDLQESNYSTWSYFFKGHCSNFNVLNHIDGSTSTSDPPTDEWITADSIVKSWIFLTLSPTLRKRMISTNPASAKAAWDTIETIFQENKRTRTVALKGLLGHWSGLLSRHLGRLGWSPNMLLGRLITRRCTCQAGFLLWTGWDEGYTDASWISNTEDSSSTSGLVFLLKGGVISWAFKKQTCITSSRIESEFVALAAAGKEAEWLRNLILEIPLWSKPIVHIFIRCDSAPTLTKDYSQIYNGNSRHLGVRHNMIHELIMKGVISIKFLRELEHMYLHIIPRMCSNLLKGQAKEFLLNGLNFEQVQSRCMKKGNYLCECEVFPFQRVLAFSSCNIHELDMGI